MKENKWNKDEESKLTFCKHQSVWALFSWQWSYLHQGDNNNNIEEETKQEKTKKKRGGKESRINLNIEDQIQYRMDNVKFFSISLKGMGLLKGFQVNEN